MKKKKNNEKILLLLKINVFVKHSNNELKQKKIKVLKQKYFD